MTALTSLFKTPWWISWKQRCFQPRLDWKNVWLVVLLITKCSLDFVQFFSWLCNIKNQLPSFVTEYKMRNDGFVSPCQVEMKKSATAGTHFNARVVECRLAAKVSYNKHNVLNPLRQNIPTQILQSDLHTFPWNISGRIWWKIKAFSLWWSLH